MSTENGAKHKHQVDGTSHPVVDIEELDKELRLRSRNRKMQRERENKKEGSKEMKKSELRDLLSSVSEGNVVALCTCQQSKDFPYCDNTHAVFNKATNSNLSPLYIAFVEGKKGVCDECGSKKKNTSQTQDNSTAPESPGCSITLSDCTNTDSSILDNDTPTTSTSSTSTSSTTTSPTLTLRRRSIRKSTETATTCQCSTTTSSPTHPHTTNASTTSHNTDTTSRDSTNRDTTSKDSTSRDTTSTTSSSVSREESVDITLPHSSDPEEDDDHNTNDNNNKEGKEESKTITTPPVILATSNATTTRDEESEGKATTTAITYIPSSIKDPRNRDNIISKYEVSQHNTQTDLWMIIKGNVYDITKYVKSHPGGVRALVKFAGRDGTENVQYHSSAMLEILNSRYYIGRLPKEDGGPGGGCIIC